VTSGIVFKSKDKAGAMALGVTQQCFATRQHHAERKNDASLGIFQKFQKY
jgi:hypothetical protein